MTIWKKWYLNISNFWCRRTSPVLKTPSLVYWQLKWDIVHAIFLPVILYVQDLQSDSIININWDLLWKTSHTRLISVQHLLNCIGFLLCCLHFCTLKGYYMYIINENFGFSQMWLCHQKHETLSPRLKYQSKTGITGSPYVTTEKVCVHLYILSSPVKRLFIFVWIVDTENITAL